MCTVRFKNDHFGAITGYGDYVHGNVTICHVYYVEGLGHNLFSVSQFCDGDLEVSIRYGSFFSCVLNVQSYFNKIMVMALKTLTSKFRSLCYPTNDREDLGKMKPKADIEAESSSTAQDSSNMHEFNQVYPSAHTKTNDHPLEQVIGDPSKPVMTRSRLNTNAEVCMYALTVSTAEPKNIKEAMLRHNWIESMQDELHQF
ncbi:hypothetical protein Tco_1298962 [Tanacetum coccineum]